MSLLDDLKKLVDALEALPPPPEPVTAKLNIECIHDQFEWALTEEAKAALAPEKKSTIWAVYARDQDGKDDLSKAIFLSGIAHTPEGIARAAEAIYGQVNILAEQGVLCGHLAKLSVIKLFNISGWIRVGGKVVPDEKRYAVFCFPHVRADWEGKVLYQVHEGEVGPDFDALQPVTQPLDEHERPLHPRCQPDDPCFEADCPACKGGPPSAG